MTMVDIEFDGISFKVEEGSLTGEMLTGTGKTPEEAMGNLISKTNRRLENIIADQNRTVLRLQALHRCMDDLRSINPREGRMTSRSWRWEEPDVRNDDATPLAAE